MQLEDVDHLFESGGITGGVFKAKDGMTVQPGWHTSHPNMHGVEKLPEDAMGIEMMSRQTVDV